MVWSRFLINFNPLNSDVLLILTYMLLLDLLISHSRNIERCILAIEVLRNFLHRCESCFDHIEINNDDFETQEYAVEEVVLPVQSVKGDSIDVLVEEQCGGNAEIKPCETFSTETVR